uniref:Uncharacterized protein n=1 Tax=Pygocentrus nattereri TaxID=42514 RepID=A0AAR2J0X4_PYGNA
AESCLSASVLSLSTCPSTPLDNSNLLTPHTKSAHSINNHSTALGKQSTHHRFSQVLPFHHIIHQELFARQLDPEQSWSKNNRHHGELNVAPNCNEGMTDVSEITKNKRGEKT